MNQKDKLKEIFGKKCTAININGESDSFINIPIRKMSLCQAVDQSFRVPLRISSENLDCPGARRSVGFENNEKQLIKEISEHSHISGCFIRNALRRIPVITGIRHINLGLTESMENDLQPDLYIIYVKPFIITDLMHNLAKMGIEPLIPSYSFLSVCGSVLANCYSRQAVSVSFGCPESRNHGGIGENEVVLGLPAQIASKLLQYYEQVMI